MPTAAREIAEWSATLTLDDIPDHVRADAKLHLLDTLGCGLAAHAARDRDRGPDDDGRARRRGAGDGDRHRARLPAANAAFANAMLCHGLDFDDTHSDSVSHISAR